MSGIDFSFTDEQIMLRKTVRDFLAKECPSSYMAELDEQERYPHDLRLKMAELGLYAMAIPGKYGGLDGTEIDRTIIAEECGRVAGTIGMLFVSVAVFGGGALMECGTEEQRQRILPGLGKGETIIVFALTEPNSGSDAAALRTTADADGDDFVLNGSKIFCTGALIADYIVTVVRTNRSVPNHKGLSLFLVDRKSPGLSIRPLPKLGYKAIQTCEVGYDNVRVPRANLMGEVDQGWPLLLRTLDVERISTAAMAVGMSDGAFSYALQYSKEREQFGQPIGKFQVISHMLADMAAETEVGRLLTYQAASKKTQGIPCSLEASMAKAYSTELATRTATRGMQIMGGYGYMMEYDMQRYYREAKLLEVAGGSNQIQHEIIAKLIGL